MKNTLDILDILFKSIPFIIAIYYFLVFIINSETEERQMYIYGYNRKSMNLFITTNIIAWSMLPIMYKLFVEQKDYLTVLLSFNLNIILILLFYIFYKKLNNRIVSIVSIFSIFIIFMAIIIHLGIDNGIIDNGIIANIINIFSIIFSIISIGISIYLLKKENTASLYSNCEKLYFVIVPLVFSNFLLNLYFITSKIFRYSIFIMLYISISIVISLYLYPKFNKLNKKLFQISFDKTDLTSNKTGFIISETNDDIVFDIDRGLHRYRKSDIYCIKEIEESNLDLLNIIINDIQSLKKGIDSIRLSEYKKEKIKPEIEDIYSKLLNLQKKME